MTTTETKSGEQDIERNGEVYQFQYHLEREIFSDAGSWDEPAYDEVLSEEIEFSGKYYSEDGTEHLMSDEECESFKEELLSII